MPVKKLPKPKRADAQALAPPNRDKARPGARRFLEAACARCGTAEGLQAHHLDGNWRNNAKENVTTLCASCHSAFHSGRWKGPRGDPAVQDGRRTDARWTNFRYGSTPLPRKTKKELAHAAAWSARQLLHFTVEAATSADGRVGRWHIGWTSMKRRFFIAGQDNERLTREYIAACDRLRLIPTGSIGWVAMRSRGLRTWQSPADWYAENRGRVAELLQRAKAYEGKRPVNPTCRAAGSA